MKLPVIAKGADEKVKDGMAYAYGDAKRPALSYSKYGLDDKQGAVTFTLQQLYRNKSKAVAYGMYNGERLSTHPPHLLTFSQINHRMATDTTALDI